MASGCLVNETTERRALWVLRLAGSAVLVLFLASVAVAPCAPVRGLAAIVHLPAIEWSVLPLGIAWLKTYVRAFRR